MALALRATNQGQKNMQDPDLFNARRMPARLTIDQASRLLGFHADSLDHLVNIRMLDMLGGPAPGTQRMFASAYILELCDNVEWLAKATRKVRQHHSERNAQKAARHNRTS
jgi:hypothetical protein